MNQDLAKKALQKYFGYDAFRPMQADIIQAVYDKKDTVVLMPTGGGKSLCFQIPAITMEGMCIVVSPLISLMKDQVEALRANGISAAFMNSSMNSAELQEVEEEVYHNRIKLLYVSPEKMVSQSFMPIIRQGNINLFAIDEAHCISSWGHDFRPEYTQMQFLKNQYPDIPVIALTATADKLTRKDIVSQLRLQSPEVFIASFDRPNISLTVRPGQKRMEQMLEFVKERPKQAGIIYCLSRKSCEQVASKLISYGLRADYYHAGMDSRERDHVQTQFLNDNVQIVCATVAFGMGIDKSNVRWVIHYNLPKNMEGYYQEIGRCGRDGADSDTLLFYSYRDISVYRDMLSQGEPRIVELKLAKLDRIQQYAEASICRRKILLSYFGENLEKDCGNCDVCKNPPKHFDGTVLTQKALSAIMRTQQRVGINLLVDILRGSKRKDVISNNYDKIKTYGAGADISQAGWNSLILQMLNSGLIEIAYDQRSVLKVTNAGRAVLFDGKKVQLVKMDQDRKRKEVEAAKVKTTGKRDRVRDELFEVLRGVRKQVAVKQGVPPYIVFSDVSLEEMAAAKPITELEMRRINGVGDKKWQLYGEIFINAILTFDGKPNITFTKPKTAARKTKSISTTGKTHLETLQLFNRGYSIAQIAMQRQIQERTISSHLVELYARGEKIDLKRILTKSELGEILQVMERMSPPFMMRPIFDALDGKMDYNKIQFALAYYHREVEVD
ncbi:MAG: DNA helicase RecQ [Saprospiraceae bacterium]